MRIAGTPTHTAEELNNQFVVNCVMTDKELQERLHELGVPYKHKPRGKASPDYGFKKGWDELKARLNQKYRISPRLQKMVGRF